ncbi:hypothetical protein FPQ18DRAFT_282754 [Pyronema domesticum]|nr:hypothetical protein FPQ18DRAFT_282754 [Pyronema domesticum]
MKEAQEIPHISGGVSAPSKPKNWVPLTEEPLFTPRKIRIVTVGAGVSGLNMAHKIQHQYKMEDYIDHQIYEKNSEIGGTWFENIYPGVGCDIPSNSYSLPFEPNPQWSKFYVGGAEIQEYLQRAADKWNLKKNVAFNSRLFEAVWDEASAQWQLKIEQNGKIIYDKADMFVDGSGILNKPRYPTEIPGFNSYKGHRIHSAKWDKSYDYAEKRIAVIGNGSSAIQIVPQLQKIAGHLYNVIRSPTWVTPNYLTHHTKDGAGGNFEYTQEEKDGWEAKPEEFHKYRKTVENDMNVMFPLIFKGSDAQKEVFAAATEVMKQRLNGDVDLINKLVPTWEFACRRITPGDGYLESLQMSNVTPLFGSIDHMTGTGLVINGRHIEVDVIVCATGFDVSHVPAWKCIGKNGVDLGELWQEDPEGYMGIVPPHMPNYFKFLGPNAPIGHGSFMPLFTWTGDYILRWAKKIATEDIRYVTVKPGAVDDYNVFAQEFLKYTVWSAGCRSWYKKYRTTGKVTGMYPGSVIHYYEMLKVIRGEDFDISYRSTNRFRFFGNGLTRRELDKGDLAYYFDEYYQSKL